MRVGAAEAEGVDAGAGRAAVLGPVDRLGRDLEGQRGQVDAGVGALQVEVRRDAAVLEGERGLDQPGDAGRGLGVPDVGLDRADVAAVPGAAADAEHPAERGRLDRVADRRGGAVRLDVLQAAGQHPGFGADPFDQGDLGVRAGDGDAVGAAVLVDAAAEDDGVHRVPVALCVGEPLEHDHADALGPDVAVGGGVEGARAAVRGEEAALGLGDRVLRCHVQQRTAGQGEFGLAAEQALAGQVDRDQGGAARGVDRDAGTAEVEAVRDPVGHHRHHGAGGGVRGDGGEVEVGELQDLPVEGEGAHVDADFPAGQLAGAQAAVLQRLPADLKELALLRVHVLGLARADPEELRVEGVEAVDVAAPAADQPPPLGPVPAAQGAGVVPVGGRLGETVPALDQVAPVGPVVVGVSGQAAADTGDRDGFAGHGEGRGSHDPIRG